MKLRALFLILFVIPCTLPAETGDDTLMFVMKKSDLVVAAEITSMSGPSSDKPGAALYNLKCRNMQALYGQLPAGDNLPVVVTHPELKESDQLPHLTNGTRCILFLKKDANFKTGEFWKTADVWFSIQPDNSYLEARIKDLSKDVPKTK